MIVKKGALLGIIITLLSIALIVAYFFIFAKKGLEKAIDEFEDRDYKEAIHLLNRIAKTADHDKGEKIYYYRCKAINGLAAQLEEKLSDELAASALEKKGTGEFKESKKEIEDKLADINKKIDGDLTLVLSMKKSRIRPRGKFYDEFVSRYKGSRLIEDLQFEEIQILSRTDPDKLVPSMIQFYGKYPGTDHISSMVHLLFEGLQTGRFKTAGDKEILWSMILSYVRRYPTSPETNKLYACTGNNVNLRNSPGVDGKLVGKVAKDEILIQLEKSMDTTQVGDSREYWYRVASLQGPKGWIFGKFLSPIDPAKYREPEAEKKWSMEELFADWSDSHTPANWGHITGADRTGINFSARGNKKIAEINSAKGSQAGLFTAFTPTRSFEILCRARYTGGDAVTIFACVLSEGKAFYVKLGKGVAEFSGRTIPLNTSGWHEYMLSSEDGKHAQLAIDGEAVSSRIEPVKNKFFTSRGIYCLFSSKDEESKGEIEFIKVR
jgi:hypothetical protein